MSIDFWKLDGTRFSTLPDLVSYNGYVKDINGDVYETKANSGIVSKKQFTYNLTANSSWLSGTGNAISNIAIGSDGSLTATKVNLDDRYFTETEIKANYIPWDTRWNGTGGGFYKDGNVFINGNGYSDYLTNILTGIKNTINGLGSIYAKIGDCYTKAESDGRYALKTELANKQDKLGFTPVQQGGGYLQGTNKIKIGWSGSELRCQVDNTDMGGIAFKSNISNAKIIITQGGEEKGSFTLNGSGGTIKLDAGGGASVGKEQTLYTTQSIEVGSFVPGSYLYSNAGGDYGKEYERNPDDINNPPGKPTGQQTGTWVVTSEPQAHHVYDKYKSNAVCGQSTVYKTTVYSLKAKPMQL